MLEGLNLKFHLAFSGNCIRGNPEDRVKLLFRLLGRPSDQTLPRAEVEAFVARVVLAASNAMAPGGSWEGASRVMARELGIQGGERKRT